MIGKTRGYRSTAAAVAAALWGMAPFAAQAVGPPQAELVTVTSSQDRGCGPVAGAFGAAGGGKPFTVAVEPRVDAVKAAPFSGVGTSEIVSNARRIIVVRATSPKVPMWGSPDGP